MLREKKKKNHKLSSRFNEHVLKMLITKEIKKWIEIDVQLILSFTYKSQDPK